MLVPRRLSESPRRETAEFFRSEAFLISCLKFDQASVGADDSGDAVMERFDPTSETKVDDK